MKKKNAPKSSVKASGLVGLAPAFTLKTFNQLREQGKGPPFVLRDGEAYYEWKNYRKWFKSTVIPLCSGEKVDVYTGKEIKQYKPEPVVKENRGGVNHFTEQPPSSFADKQVFTAYLQGMLHQNADLTTHQVAMIMRVPSKCMENMRTHDTGPQYFKIGSGRILYKFGDIRDYMNSLTNGKTKLVLTQGYGSANGKNNNELHPIGIEG